MKLGKQIKSVSFAKSQIRSAMKMAPDLGKTQSNLQDDYHTMRQSLRDARLPIKEERYLDGYFEACLDNLKEREVEFFYLVDGKFYTTSPISTPDRLNWATLPRDMWDKLSDKGGLYYTKNLKPFHVYGE